MPDDRDFTANPVTTAACGVKGARIGDEQEWEEGVMFTFQFREQRPVRSEEDDPAPIYLT